MKSNCVGGQGGDNNLMDKMSTTVNGKVVSTWCNIVVQSGGERGTPILEDGGELPFY